MVSQQNRGANDIDLKNPAILSTDCTNRHTNWMKLYQKKPSLLIDFHQRWEGAPPAQPATKWQNQTPTSLTCSSVESMLQKKRNKWKLGSWPKSTKKTFKATSEKHEGSASFSAVLGRSSSYSGEGGKLWRNWNSTGTCLSGGTNNRSALAGRYSHSSLSVCHTLKTRQTWSLFICSTHRWIGDWSFLARYHFIKSHTQTNA